MKTLRKRTLMIALTVTALSLFAFAGFASAQGGPSNGNGNGPGVPPAPTAPLTADEMQALNDMLQDEYHAWAVYDSVIADFGQVAPFVQIQKAEAQHAAVLERLFTRYGLELPENEWAEADIPSFDSVEAACVAGVAAEIANAELYDWALSVTDKPDLTNVFTHLQAASLESHLPAFEACDIVAPADGSGRRNTGDQQNARGQQVGQGQHGGMGQGHAGNNGQPDPANCTNPDGPQYDQNRANNRGGRGGRS